MNKIKKTGVAGVLKKRGLVDGDTVIIGKLVFTFKE
jgi:hypothetical protein